jgi:hypothetical protein
MSLGTLGKQTVAAGGTPQQLSLTTLNCKGFFIQAVLGNTHDIYIGNKNMVTTTLAGTFRVIPAPAAASGATVLLPSWDVITDLAGPFDLSAMYLDGTTGESVLVSYVI